MAEETLTIDGQEVKVTNTDDGFEVEPVEDDPEGLYLRAEEDHFGGYGCEIPINADFHLINTDDRRMHIAWNEEDDISDLKSNGAEKARAEADQDFDHSAAVDTVDLVEY